MARVSIYVSDELKARMDGARDALNWSDIARPAFETALAALNHRRTPTMQTTIERLRASKAQHEQQQETEAKQAGRDWAANRAAYADLEKLSLIDLDLFGNGVNDLHQAVKSALDPENRQDEIEFWAPIIGCSHTEEWLMLFVEGAQDFFEEVREQI